MNSRIVAGLRVLPQRGLVASPPRRMVSSSSAPATPNDQPATPNGLTWAKYLSLRKSKHRAGIVTTIPTTLLGLSSGVNYFASIEAEPTDLILGIEPVFAYGIATVACIGAGWLAGPILGYQIWQLFNRRILPEMEAKDKDFWEHIKRFRVDPSRQSVSNPVPDYYCEKVGTLAQYRQWLRDQSAYRRKSRFGDGEDEAL